jgi:hypothetical protein
MSQQSVRQAARRSALDAKRRKERAARVCRLEGLAVEVLTALGGRDGAVGDGGVNEVLTGRGLGQRHAGLAAVCRPIRSNAKRGWPGTLPEDVTCAPALLGTACLLAHQ